MFRNIKSKELSVNFIHNIKSRGFHNAGEAEFDIATQFQNLPKLQAVLRVVLGVIAVLSVLRNT